MIHAPLPKTTQMHSCSNKFLVFPLHDSLIRTELKPRGAPSSDAYDRSITSVSVSREVHIQVIKLCSGTVAKRVVSLTQTRSSSLVNWDQILQKQWRVMLFIRLWISVCMLGTLTIMWHITVSHHILFFWRSFGIFFFFYFFFLLNIHFMRICVKSSRGAVEHAPHFHCRHNHGIFFLFLRKNPMYSK